MSADAAGLRLAVAVAVAAEAPPPAVKLSHPADPRLCLALAASRNRVVWRAPSVADDKVKWEMSVDGDDKMTFKLCSSGQVMTIAHVSTLLLDTAFFHPCKLDVPAQWKLVADETNGTGELLHDGGAIHVVCANALQNSRLEVKISPWEEGNGELGSLVGSDEAVLAKAENEYDYDAASVDEVGAFSATSIYGCLRALFSYF